MGITFLNKSKGFPSGRFHHNVIDDEVRQIGNSLAGKKLTNDAVRNYRRSVVTTSRIEADLLETKVLNWNPNEDILKYACSKAAIDFKLPERVFPCHLNDVQMYDINWAASAGLPFILEEGPNSKDFNYDEALATSRWLWHRVKEGDSISFPDNAAYARSHLVKQDEDDKVRAIWGLSFLSLLGEGMFAGPLTKAYKSIETPIAWDMPTLKGGMAKLHNKLVNNKGNYVTLDYKKFDKSVHERLIREAFYILECQIDFTKYEPTEEWPSAIPEAVKLKRAWDKVVNDFIHTKIRSPSGKRFVTDCGIASGSWFTQLIGSIVNAIAINYAEYSYTGTFPSYYKVLGDDSVFVSQYCISVEEYADAIYDLGIVVNMDKSRTTTNPLEVKFLGFMNCYGAPFLPTEEWLAKLFHPERPDESLSDVSARAIGLAWANAGSNGLVHEIMMYVTRHCGMPNIDMSKSRWMQQLGIEPGMLARFPEPEHLFVHVV